MALPRGTDAQTIGANASGGMLLGDTSSELVAFHGATPTDQCAAISTLTLTTSLQSGFGFQTSAGFNAFITAFASVLTCLKDHGLMNT